MNTRNNLTKSLSSIAMCAVCFSCAEKMKILAIFALFSLCTSLNAQFQFGVSGQVGISKFIEIDNQVGLQIGSKYFPRPSYQIGGELRYGIWKNRIQPSIGLNLYSFASELRMPDHWIVFMVEDGYFGPFRWEERFYAVQVPIKIGINIFPFLNVNAGMVFSKFTKLSDKAKEFNIVNKSSVAFIAGIEGWYKHFSLGINHRRDIKPLMQRCNYLENEIYDIHYYLRDWSLNLSYWF